MKNQAVADRLREIADYLEMQDVEYKPRAYRKAARRVESLNEPVEEVHERGELQDLDGVGESIAEKIADYVETGSMDYYQDLREDLPLDIEALTGVESIGPKRAKRLYRELGVTDLEELERAAEEGRIAGVEGFGERIQETILDHVEQAKKHEERTLIGRAFPRARELRERFEASDNFDRVDIVGSFRRRRPTVGDLDVLATSSDPEAAMAEFCEDDDVREVLARGETKSSVVAAEGLQIDLRIVDDDEYGSAMVYFTGSADHNIALRNRALDRDWKLNEYGLFDVSEDGDGKRTGERVAGDTEEGVYEALDLAFVPPELREDTGEVAAAAADDLPDLLEVGDVRGDLQTHTTYSDGSASVDEMAAAADEKGHEYLLVTDHGPDIAVTGGVDAEELADQREEVDDADEAYDVDVRLGVEANVSDDGIDVSEAAVEEVDHLVVACHGTPENPTEAVCSVLESRPVDVLGHPLNRKIHEREPLDVDLERVVDTAADERVALEINAQPERLDLPWERVKEYRDDAQFVVSTDAHATGELDLLHLGVAQARRGWLEADDVLNTRPLDEVREWFAG